MKILLCNPKNSQGTKHSRKGMYVPLGILSIATCLEEKFGDRVNIDVRDEDAQELDIGIFRNYDLIGLYSTTFNYATAVKYAYFCKEYGCITVLGGPHASVLAQNILTNRNCFDYVLLHEAEVPFADLIGHLLDRKPDDLAAIANLAFRSHDGDIIVNPGFLENDLTALPIPSRKFVPFELYMDNYRKIYPDRTDIRPGSIYSSKGCSWRDKTGGCLFCARLEEGVRFRDIDQIWAEIRMLVQEFGVNSIWDIADDNLNNKEWFKEFVRKRPDICKNLKFFIYSRVLCIKPWVFEYFDTLNVEEVFLGVESGDNRILKKSFKGQTRQASINAITLLSEHNIRYYPSFVLGLPGESMESLENTLSLCKEIAELGGLDRMAATIMKPIPGSRAYDMVISESRFGKDLVRMDDIDLAFLERYWIERFTDVEFSKVEEYRNKINEIMGDCQVFGSSVRENS